ncbi:MAG: MBL fold metallo-hydrolase [Chloroflexi bacterium]|nr:MBL fold metallo-hydrolase [Chloroflexota bacterium]
MLLKFFYDPGLAQASYLIGCQEIGEALIIDPARDVTPYLAAAEDEGLKITQVAETHIHADYLSGTRELAAATGAVMYLSDTGGDDWKYQFTDPNTVLLKDGDTWQLGNVKIEVIATPGHTPEHVCLLMANTANSGTPVGIFTGDCLFVGAVGRPDLLETAAGITHSAGQLARRLFDSLQHLKDLPDYVQVWPGHGAGSACGKSMSSMPFSTIGFEKLTNPALQFTDKAVFADWLLIDQPEPPAYFGHMKKVNKEGPTLLRDVVPPQPLEFRQLDDILDAGHLVIDTRSGHEYAYGHIPGTLNAPSTSRKFNTYAGWLINYSEPFYFIAHEEQLDYILHELRAIGADSLAGYWTADVFEYATVMGQIEYVTMISASELEKGLDIYFVLDVRSATEFKDGHIPGAYHAMYGLLDDHLQNLPDDLPIAIYCQTGIRSIVAASMLLKHGITNVVQMEGGYEAWQALNRSLEQNATT